MRLSQAAPKVIIDAVGMVESILCAAAGSTFERDAAYTAAWLGEYRSPAQPGTARLGYLEGTDPKDPLQHRCPGTQKMLFNVIVKFFDRHLAKS